MKNFLRNSIYDHQTIREALVKLDEFGAKINLTLFVLGSEDQMVGTITDGDIRRGLIKGLSLEDKVGTYMRVNFRFLSLDNISMETLVSAREAGVRLLPVLDQYNKIHKIIDLTRQKSLLPVEAVLMAGGRGERLKPLTDTMPKPMLPLGGKPIVQYNIENLVKYGIDRIHISVKYLADKITEYFKDGEEFHASIDYVNEEKPLGTMGALSLIENFRSDYILVMNSDLFTDINFEDFFLHFIESGADMAVASVPYNVSVPYGVLEIKEGNITSIIEKPTYTYFSNAGIYLMKREVLHYIPAGNYFDATDLMQKLIDQNRKLAYFPIVGYWIDIGKPDDYKKAQEYVKYAN